MLVALLGWRKFFVGLFRIISLAIYGVECELQSVGSSQLIKNSEQVVSHGIFAQPELRGDVAIGQSFADELDDAFLATRQGAVSVAFVLLDPRSDFFALYQRIECELQLCAARPHFSPAHGIDALA